MGRKNAIPFWISQSATRTIWPQPQGGLVIITNVIIVLLHGLEAVNCAATLTTSGQTWEKERRGKVSASSKSKTDLKLPICIKATRWIDSDSDCDSPTPNSGGDQAQCLSNAICKLSMAATDDNWQLTMLTCQSVVPPSCLPPLSPHTHTNNGWWSKDR